ncbi:hypothetical protein M0R45_010283 [Rubus argutus]|uniref:Uncharacterized protein n=1 Tax=Rubus argutus TaxID=59490 RepID=A0AAW1Y9K4_RUBAR
MSRCFPFPPPGYERKDRIDDIDLLAKENRKEKKHKKDKKDQEKRDGKEKKDKDRNKEKHSERKDPKEKHKDKKERDGNNRTTQNSEEKRIEQQPESSNRQNHCPNGMHSIDIKDIKFVQELDRRYRNGDGAVGSQAVPKIVVTDPRPISNHFQEKERTKDAKEVIMSANAQRNHVEEGKCVADGFVQKFPSIDQRRVEEIAKAFEKDVEKQMEGRERQRKSDHDSRGHKLKDREKERKVKSKDKGRDNKKEKKEKKEKVREISKPSDEQSSLKGSGKDSIDACNNKAPDLLQLNGKYSVAEGSLGKHKQLEMNGYLLGKKKKVKEISKPPTGKPVLNGSGSNFPNDCSNKAVDLLQRNGKNSAAGVTLGKRKELEMNGHLHENGFLPQKLPKPVSFHPVVDNERKSEPCQTVLKTVSEGQEAASNGKVDIKEHIIVGLRGSGQPDTRPSSSSTKVKENGEASAKPPHPDSKYLSQILTIPKMGDRSDDFDDQEWLFSSIGLGSKKAKVGSPGVESTPQVWAEAMQIESVDVFALPYVIPY